MGKRGPIGDGPRIRALKGRRDAGTGIETAGSGRAPRLPAGLEPEIAATWRREVPGLAESRRLTRADVPLLVEYCTCLVRVAECEKLIGEQGVVVKGERGLVKHPACQLAKSYRESLLKLSAKLGASPADRDRIQPAPPAEVYDPLEEFLSRPTHATPDVDPRSYLAAVPNAV